MPADHSLSVKRLEQLKKPYLASEVRTIEAMVRIYCRAHHPNLKPSRGPCDEPLSSDYIGRGPKAQSLGICECCEDFLLYSTKRIACCPFGEEKPACQKCTIHCFGGDYKEKAKIVMRFSGPKMLFKNPILALNHVFQHFRKPPAKPQNKKSASS